MPFQPPRFGPAPKVRKPWARPEGQPDLRKRGRAGQRDRRQVLDEEPLCRLCLAKGKTAASSVVDHIIPLSEGGTDDRINKQGLCAPCHDAKSAAERAVERAFRIT